MNYLLMLLKLLPYIAAGVSVIHSDASTGEKKQIATDLLSLSTAASQQVLTGQNAELAATVGTVATQTVSSVIDALHPHTTTVK